MTEDNRGWKRTQTVRNKISLARAARSIVFVATKFCVFVATKPVFCRDRIMLVATNIFLLRQNVSSDKHNFVALMFCCGKHTFVATKDVTLVAAPADDSQT